MFVYDIRKRAMNIRNLGIFFFFFLFIFIYFLFYFITIYIILVPSMELNFDVN